MKISGVYMIQSKVIPERIYVGSAVNIYHRWQQHRGDLKRGKHHSIKMQRHYNKYGLDDLVFSVMAVCEKEELRPINKIIRPEQFFIWAYAPYFNILPTAGSNYGWVQSDKTKEKLRQANLGKKQSEETILKRVAKLKGKPNKLKGTHQTAERIEQRVSKLRGRKMPEGFSEKASIRMMGNKNGLGKKLSEEKREKLRIAQTGRKYSDESRKKMRESHLGKPNPMKGKKTGKPAWNRGLKKGEKRNVGY